MNNLNDSNLQEFYPKFGPNIKNFRSFRQLIDFNRFPNIEKIKISPNIDDSIISNLKLDKLKQLEIMIEQGKEHKLQTIIDTFPTLTHLKVSIRSKDENAIYNSLKNISNLKHLIHFYFHNEFGKNNNLLIGLLKQMANNWQNMKSIDCRFVIRDNNSEIRQFFSLLKSFPALKRLNFWFYYVWNEEEDNIDVNQLFSFELFKGFSNITHLTLYFDQISNEKTLKDIDINLPKLQYLEIKDIFDTTPEGVQQIAEILSRLSRLETLKLKFKSGVDFKPIEDKIIEKCRKIRRN